MGANEVIKGRYSMVTTGFTIDHSLTVPGATIRGPDADYPANLKVLEPVAALGIVSYDGGDDPSGGTVHGSGVLRFTSDASFVKFTGKTGAAQSAVEYVGTSALDGKLGQQPEPIALKQFEILPISRYWIDDPERLTGRAVMFVKHGTGALVDSAISVLHFYFVLEERKANPDRVLKIAFVATDTRFFSAPFQDGAVLKIPVDPPTPFIEWGTQTRISDGFLAAPSLLQLAGNNRNLMERIWGFAKSLGLTLPPN